jgi:hypothetical protein
LAAGSGFKIQGLQPIGVAKNMNQNPECLTKSNG